MKLTFKTAVITASLGLFSVSAPTISYADQHGQKMQANKPSAEFMQKLQHASFMPNLMRHLMMNKSTLELNADQLSALKGYNQENSPKVQAMVGKLMDLEAKAQQMALENASVDDVVKVGEQSIQIRTDLLKAKLKCREFVKSVLTPAQYEQTLTTYKS